MNKNFTIKKEIRGNDLTDGLLIEKKEIIIIHNNISIIF